MAVLSAFMVPHPPLILPEIGKGEEQEIQKTIDSYHETARRIGEKKPETIILISPHQVMYADYFHISPGQEAEGDFRQFGVRQVKQRVKYDTELAGQICRLADERNLPAGPLGERDNRLDHGTMVPLYFVNQYWEDYRLVRIGLSGLPLVRHYELGQCIARAVEITGRKTVIIASGDLSHRLREDGPYGYQKEGPEYDARIMDVMGHGDFGELFAFPENFCEKAGECGHRAFTIMAGVLDGREIHPERLSYEGPFGVGYGVCAYEIGGEDTGRKFLRKYEEERERELSKQKEQEDAYVRLARRTIEAYVNSGEMVAVPEGLPDEMYSEKAGVFVSIKEDGRLRGCIGTIQAVYDSIAEEIIENAVSASTRDPRFSPIEPWELERLTISVDVLGTAEKVDSPEELDVKRYGVIVSKGRKRGLLLPNLDGVDTVEEQIAIAKQKAGIDLTEKVKLERFEVIRHF